MEQEKGVGKVKIWTCLGCNWQGKGVTSYQKPLTHVLGEPVQFPGHATKTNGGKCSAQTDQFKEARKLINAYVKLLTAEAHAQKRQKLNANEGSLVSSFNRVEYDPAAGQGTAERLLRMITRTRTSDRNRQHAAATLAFCKARMLSKTVELQADRNQHKSYIEYVQKQLRNAHEVALKEALAKEEAAAKKPAEATGAAGMVVDDGAAAEGGAAEGGAAEGDAAEGDAADEGGEEEEGDEEEADAEEEKDEERPELFEVIKVAGDHSDDDDAVEDEEVRMVGFAAQVAMRLAREDAREEARERRQVKRPARYRA